MKKADFVKAIEEALGDDGSPLTPHGEAIAAGDGTLHGAIDYWQKRCIESEINAFTLAAGQCCVKDGGLMADDHGHQYCDMERQRDEWKRKAEEAARDAMREGYALGFLASGEGYNAEYPFGDNGQDFKTNPAWIEERDEAIDAAIAAKGEA